jgi:uncharacterized protein (TIGR03118 family)
MSIIRMALAGSCLLLAVSSGFAASVGSFSETALVTSATDPDLVNPWGVSFSATSPFWISDNGTGKATLYNTAGVKQGLVVSMPSGSTAVTGQVFNGTASFNGDTFLFASENGTIAGWRGALGTTAEQVFAPTGAAYKGLAISDAKDVLFAANFAQGTIDVFSGTTRIGAFSDPTVPAGYAPFNVQNIGGKFYVTFALRSGIDDMPGAGNGFVDIFDPTAHTFSRLVSQGALNSPWGIAIAPGGFGSIGGDLLVGNFGDGLINIYDPVTFALIGSLGDPSGNPIVNDGLWALTFGNGGNGGLTNSLYLTAGPNDEAGGLFARIDAVPEPSTILLSCFGLALFALWRSRSTRQVRL